MRGYDIKEVDQLVALVEDGYKNMAAGDRGALLGVLRSKQAAEFPTKFRGYSKI